MDWDRKSIRLGVAVICCALLLRLATGSWGQTLFRAVSAPRVASVLLLLETGRVVKVPTPTAPTQCTETQPPATTAPSIPEPSAPLSLSVPVFSPDDAALVQVNNVCGYEAEVAEGLTKALTWDLTEGAPTVLILHSHGTEGYAECADSYRSTDNEANVVSIGDRLVQILEMGGVRAVHDRQLHDHPSYSSAYANARQSIQGYLSQYPGIRLILDIHRDAVADSSGDQVATVTEVAGNRVAQLMLVVGTDAAGLSHPHWPENMSLAVKLHAQLERQAPGICRPISFRSQRFNQDLSPGALIVEVGTAGNTRQEALLATEILGKAILALSQGTAPG